MSDRMNLPEARRWVGVEIRPWHADMSEDVQRAALTIAAVGGVLDRVRAEIQRIRAGHPTRFAHEWAEAAGRIAALTQVETWLQETLQAPPQQVGAHSIKEGE